VAVLDTEDFGIKGIDLDEGLRGHRVQARRTSGHGAGMVVKELAAGGQHQGIFLVRQFL
jgi:hypothetical protein